MKTRLLLSFAACVAICIPAFAALKTGDRAPNFSAPASLAGREFHFSLDAALKKGPAVVYFFPSAYTGGCDLEAHTFAQDKDKFDAAGATIIGVSADNVERLNQFSADPKYCADRFPVASDSDGRIAASYKLTMSPGSPTMKDVRGVTIGHGFIERETFVIDKNHRIVAAFSSREQHLTPDAHVRNALKVVQQLAAR